MAPIRLLPYGISDFKQVRRENLYYIDKTRYIPTMEYTDHFLFLIRPRRFGKSIFLSMLRAYYDINERDNFQKIFEGLWIADHETPERGKFQILYFDFSQIGGTSDDLERMTVLPCGVSGARCWRRWRMPTVRRRACGNSSRVSTTCRGS